MIHGQVHPFLCIISYQVSYLKNSIVASGTTHNNAAKHGFIPSDPLRIGWSGSCLEYCSEGIQPFAHISYANLAFTSDQFNVGNSDPVSIHQTIQAGHG